MRARSIVVTICLLVALAAVPRAATGLASPPMPGAYYLALGDSLAVGVEGPAQTDLTCQAANAPGYVCAFYRYLKQINPQIQLDNVAESGASSCVLVHGLGNGSPCTDPLINHAVPSQLDAAVQLLKAHPGQVSPITIDIGGDDFAPLLKLAATNLPAAVAQAPAVLQSYQTNLDATLSALRTAAPNAEIIIATQYNPLGGIPTPPLPQGLGGAVTAMLASLNGIITMEAQKYNAVVADVFKAFDAHPGGAFNLTFVAASLASGNPSQIDIHPTAAGYTVYAQTVIKASGYVVALHLQAHLAKPLVIHGKSQKVTGTTSAGATLTVKVWLPKKKPHVITKRAGSDGSFVVSFKVGKIAGKGAVKVCAADAAGQTACSAKLKYRVR